MGCQGIAEGLRAPKIVVANRRDFLSQTSPSPPKGPFRTKNSTAPESVVFCYRRTFSLSVPFFCLSLLEKQALLSTLRSVLLLPYRILLAVVNLLSVLFLVRKGPFASQTAGGTFFLQKSQKESQSSEIAFPIAKNRDTWCIQQRGYRTRFALFSEGIAQVSPRYPSCIAPQVRMLGGGASHPISSYCDTPNPIARDMA